MTNGHGAADPDCTDNRQILVYTIQGVLDCLSCNEMGWWKAAPEDGIIDSII